MSRVLEKCLKFEKQTVSKMILNVMIGIYKKKINANVLKKKWMNWMNEWIALIHEPARVHLEGVKLYEIYDYTIYIVDLQNLIAAFTFDSL